MDTKTNISSSVYRSEKALSLNSLGKNKLTNKSKPVVRLQIVNQNLEDAISEVRSKRKQNPQWKLSLKAVTEEYGAKPNINESTNEQVSSLCLPQGRKDPNVTQSFCPNFQKLKYTDRMKREYQQRINSIKQKRMHLDVISLQRQIKARIDRKIKQKISLKDKARLIQEIQERRDAKMRLQDRQRLRKQHEKSLLHQSSLAKVDMLRRSKNKLKKKEINQMLSKSEQSKINIIFRKEMEEKQKEERKEILVTRYRMLKSGSQGSYRHQRHLSVKDTRTNRSAKQL